MAEPDKRPEGAGWRGWFLASPGARPRPLPAGVKAFNYALAFLLLALLLHFSFARLFYYQWDWPSVAKYWEKFLRGWLMTVGLSVASLACSVAFGLGAALAGRARLLLLRAVSAVYVEVVRGTPLLVQILVLYYCVFEAFGLRNAFVAGVLILSFFSGAYLGEMIRAGIESVGATQRESARAVGFTAWQTYRYVIFPQALRQILPPLAGQFASLIKDSSLLSVIAIGEFTLSAREINANTLSTFESYLPLAAGYLLLTFPISVLSRSLERRFRYET